MKKILTKELVDYINEQPANRAVKMVESSSHASCGCVMVQYAKDKLKGYKDRYFSCGFENITSRTKHGKISYKYLEEPINGIVPTLLWHKIFNFGDLQKIVAKLKK